MREAANRELLWQGLADGVMNTIVSDHSPCTPELKRFDSGDLGLAWAGSRACSWACRRSGRRRGNAGSRSPRDVVRWMAERPAAQAGMRRKGHLAAGYDADFCVFAPDEAFVVDVAKLERRNPVRRLDRRPLAGVVRSTWLRGTEITGDEPRGALLTPGTAEMEAALSDRPE